MSTLINKLLPGQVSSFWDVIKFALEESVPPIVGEHPDRMNHILSSILCGDIDIWVSYNKLPDGTVKFESIAAVQILYDEPSGTKNLLIYCFYGYSQVSQDSWKELFITTVKLAKEEGCNKIVAYSNVDKVINMAKFFGGDTDYTFLSFDVDKMVKNLNGLDEV